ncbi:MAG: hypothetical protein JSS09_08575, partial [Verrucomicrobia bacterium]|nr:hypothetical protein [Verrucomicrobiota bacterium]
SLALSYDEIIKRHGGLKNALEWNLLSDEKIKGNYQYLADLKSLDNLLPYIYPEVNKALIKAGLKNSQ